MHDRTEAEGWVFLPKWLPNNYNELWPNNYNLSKNFENAVFAKAFLSIIFNINSNNNNSLESTFINQVPQTEVIQWVSDNGRTQVL